MKGRVERFPGEVEVLPGCHVSLWCEALAVLANGMQMSVEGKFNDIRIVAVPGDTAYSVQDKWTKADDARREEHGENAGNTEASG